MAEQAELYSENHLAEEINEEFMNAVMPVIVFVSLEIIFGFFGNVLVLYVYLFRYHRCNFRYFVLCLAIIDITSCLTTMPGELVNLIYWYIYPVREICKVKSFFNVFTACAEGLCLLVIAIDRYRKVCRPFWWQVTPNSAMCLCAVIYTTAFILASPYIFLWGTSTHYYKYKNITVTVTTCGKDSEFKNTVYPLTYSIVVEVIMSCTLIAMLILYIFTAQRLLKKQKRLDSCLKTPTSAIAGFQRSTSNDDTGSAECELKIDHAQKTKTPTKTRFLKYKCRNSDANLRTSQESRPVDARIRRMTFIMLILTAIFIITACLYQGLLFFIAGTNEHLVDEMSSSSKAAYFFFLRLYFINHVINPIVYTSLDPHFRKVLKNLRKRLFTICTN